MGSPFSRVSLNPAVYPLSPLYWFLPGPVCYSRLLLGHCHQHIEVLWQPGRKPSHVAVSKGLEEEEQKTDRQISYKMSRILLFFFFSSFFSCWVFLLSLSTFSIAKTWRVVLPPHRHLSVWRTTYSAAAPAGEAASFHLLKERFQMGVQIGSRNNQSLCPV